MTQIADNLKQKMKGLVGFSNTNLSTSPNSNRGEGPLKTNNQVGHISVISKPSVLHDKAALMPKSQSTPNMGATTPNQPLNAEDIKILAKIEEQNRILEADRKSLKSVSSEGQNGPSRRSSNGSTSPTSLSVHSSTSFSNESGSNDSPDCVDKTWKFWGKIVNEWDDYKKKNGKLLKEMIRCGIPHHFRGLVWQLLCDAHNSPYRTKYAELLRQSSPSEKLIRRDIARTYPEQEFFKEKDGIGQEVLFNVIKAYSLVDREVGYCQGSAFIVGLLLMQMPEEESFAVFVSLMHDYRLRELFKPSMAELGLCMYQLENMLQDHAPDLMQHFQAQAFHTSMFASSWFLTLFATFFDLQLASRILDVFISEGMEIIFRIGLALLLSSQNKLMQLDMEGMLKLIQKELTDYYNKEPDLLFQKAYSLVRYNPKKMKKLEKEYMTMKEREQEEQVEMRRLRTENNLLRQRVDGLESENGALADKLIQDRVNRALEAEEKIIMGKELSIAKRQAMQSQSNSSPAQVAPPSSNGHQTDTKPGSKPDCSEAFVTHLQQELVQSKLREAESAARIMELQDKIYDLQEKNRELTDESKVAVLNEELIAVKMREAEANGAMKELTHKLHMLEDNWAKHISRTSNSRRVLLNSKPSNTSKVALQEVQEDLMSAKFRETRLTTQHAEVKQRLMELETSYQICSGQLQRSDEERCNLREKARVYADNDRILRQQLQEANSHIAHLDSKNQEALMTLKLREADNLMNIAELKQEISSLKLKKVETQEVSNFNLSVASTTDSSGIIHQLQTKILEQQRLITRLRQNNSSDDVLAYNSDHDVDSDIGNDAELLFDATITEEDAIHFSGFCGNESAASDDANKVPSPVQDTDDSSVSPESKSRETSPQSAETDII